LRLAGQVDGFRQQARGFLGGVKALRTVGGDETVAELGLAPTPSGLGLALVQSSQPPELFGIGGDTVVPPQGIREELPIIGSLSPGS